MKNREYINRIFAQDPDAVRFELKKLEDHLKSYARELDEIADRLDAKEERLYKAVIAIEDVASAETLSEVKQIWQDAEREYGQAFALWSAVEMVASSISDILEGRRDFCRLISLLYNRIDRLEERGVYLENI